MDIIKLNDDILGDLFEPTTSGTEGSDIDHNQATVQTKHNSITCGIYKYIITKYRVVVPKSLDRFLKETNISTVTARCFTIYSK